MAISPRSFFSNDTAMILASNAQRDRADAKLFADFQILGSSIIRLASELGNFSKFIITGQQQENKILDSYVAEVQAKKQLPALSGEGTNSAAQSIVDASTMGETPPSILGAGAGAGGLAAMIAGIVSSVGTDTPKNAPADIGDVTTAVKDPNVKAFLDVLAKNESGGAYNVVVGGGTFSDYSKHPERYNKELDSDAAGRYQFISTTYNPIAKRLGLKDFSPQSQDLAAVQYLKDLGTLDEVQSGDPKKVQSAIDRLKGTKWTGLKKYGPGEGVKYFEQRKKHYSGTTQAKKQSTSAPVSQQTTSQVQTKTKPSSQVASAITPTTESSAPMIAMVPSGGEQPSQQSVAPATNSVTASGSPKSNHWLSDIARLNMGIAVMGA